MRSRIKQTCHILYEVGYFLASLFSRVFNAINGGSMHQTYSARVHIEAREARAMCLTKVCDIVEMQKWIKRERRINRIFFWQDDHCAKAWTSEVSRARKTLARNGDL